MAGTTYSARVMRFRQGVYANRGQISSGCQVLLLRLSDGMDAKCIVSIPRRQLAAELHCPEPRITEWINQAKAAGFLSTVKRARQHVTAVYQGLYVHPGVRPAVPLAEVRTAVPLSESRGTDHETPNEVRPAVPPNGAQRYAQHPPQVEEATAGNELAHSNHPPQRSHEERTA